MTEQPQVTADPIRYSVTNGVALVEFNRPEKRNALDFEMVRELRGAMARASADREVRVIVLTGTGDAFCVGYDASRLAQVDTSDPRRTSRESWPLWPLDPAKRYDYQATHNFLPAVEKPVIAMINGSAAGVGLVYALYCDVCFASSEAMFSTAFVRRGIPAEHGLAWLLPRLVGQARAADLLLSGRKFSAAEAERIGLVAKVYPPDELRQATLAYAEEMAVWCVPAALRATKRQLWEAPFQTLAEANVMFKSLLPECLQSDDFREATSSFLERRPPRFRDE